MFRGELTTVSDRGRSPWQQAARFGDGESSDALSSWLNGPSVALEGPPDLMFTTHREYITLKVTTFISFLAASWPIHTGESVL